MADAVLMAKRSKDAQSAGTERPAARVDGEASPAAKVVGAVSSAVKILRYLSRSPDPVGVTRIAKDLKLNPSTCFNILRTLAGDDFVAFDPAAKTYVISWGVMDLARGATALRGDISSVQPVMERIALDHGVTVTLWQPISQNRKVLILSAHTRNAMRIQMSVGQRLPILIGATGRVMAAFSTLSRADIRKRFDEIRWDRPISFEDFLQQVRETAEQGWSIDDGNFAAGTVSVAVPILNDAGTATMAVTATMFAGQYDKERAASVVADLQEFALRCKHLAG
ncbi:DNA-binding IclR family transcriptional regulator [Rhodoligotrophos appendicifer]|uniref:IclR family transcriptional regulator n=1 Tax=Rhodoligotrophos appendicifer TaxID=987056 RepID=UPI001184CC7D|nr:IclR family transcriptional regulator [Rhodoligotrophos appendicifer]